MTTGNKLFIMAAVLLAVFNFIDFVFYGQQLRNLAGAVGFVLMAFGAWKNMNWLHGVGAVLVLGALLVKYIS